VPILLALGINEVKNRFFKKTVQMVTYAPYFAKNYDKWDNLGKIVDPVQGETVTTFTTHADAATYLKNWLTHRVEFLSEYFSAISE